MTKLSLVNWACILATLLYCDRIDRDRHHANIKRDRHFNDMTRRSVLDQCYTTSALMTSMASGQSECYNIDLLPPSHQQRTIHQCTCPSTLEMDQRDKVILSQLSQITYQLCQSGHCTQNNTIWWSSDHWELAFF